MQLRRDPEETRQTHLFQENVWRVVSVIGVINPHTAYETYPALFLHAYEKDFL